MSTDQNKATLRQWLGEMWGGGDLALVDELASSGYVYDAPGLGAIRLTSACSSSRSMFVFENSLSLGLALGLAMLLLANCGSSLQTTESQPELRIAYTSEVDIEDIPSLMAHRLLVEQGYTVTPTFYTHAELAVAALAQGDAEFSVGSGRTVWQAVSGGADLVTVMEHAANGWLILAALEIETCRDLQGRRYGQNSEGSVSKAMSDAYFFENCPGIQRETLIIPGSTNRAAALLVGEVDATSVKVADAVEIERRAPGRYHVLVNFAHDLPMLKTTGVYANGHFAARHPEMVKDYIRALLTIHRRIARNPDLVIAETNKWLTIDGEILQQILEAQMAVNTWDVNGGLDEQSIQLSLDFFTRAGKLPPGLTVREVADLSYLTEVLDEMGRE